MIKAFQYGLLQPVSGFDKKAIDVLFLRNRLWNDLVALEREYREKYRQLVNSSSEELASINAEIEKISSEKDSLVSAKKKIRAAARSKKVDTSEIDTKIRACMTRLGELRSEAKAIRVKVKERIKPLVAELDKERYERVKEIVRKSGLWWGNYETVVESYDTARVMAMKEGTELKFRAFDGTGKFSVRSGSGGFTMKDLLDGALSYARVTPLPESMFAHLSERGKRSRARHLLTITIFTYKDEEGNLRRHEVTWPIIFHRPLPENARVKRIYVQRKRLGSDYYWTCSFTVDVDETPKTLMDHPSKKACGIDFGYRIVNDGLRVATLVGSDGATKHLVLPNKWLQRMDHVENIQGWLSEQANMTWARLKKVFEDLTDVPEEISEIIGKLRNAGNNASVRVMRLLHTKLRALLSVAPEALGILDEWEASTRRKEREMYYLRDKLLNWRKDIYRNFASFVAKEYALIRVEDMDIKKMSVVHTDNGSDNPLPNAVRNNRVRAAIHSLMLYIKHAASKTGAEFEKMSAFNSTVTCSVCGHVNNHVDLSDLHFRCEKCDTLHDQDENAARNFLSGGYLEHSGLCVDN